MKKTGCRVDFQGAYSEVLPGVGRCLPSRKHQRADTVCLSVCALVESLCLSKLGPRYVLLGFRYNLKHLKIKSVSHKQPGLPFFGDAVWQGERAARLSGRHTAWAVPASRRRARSAARHSLCGCLPHCRMRPS